MGLEGISLSSVNSERGVYHRSTNVDKWLLQGTYPAQAVEWKGYLVILHHGEIFLADSRQFAKHETGGYQYEWYYLNDVGEYVGQSERFFFPSASPRYSDELLYTDLYHNGIRFEVKNEESFYEGTVKEANPSFDASGTSGDGSVTVRYAEEVDAYGNLHYYIVDSDGEMHGGRFSPAVAVAEGSDVLYFGTAVGRIFVSEKTAGNSPWSLAVGMVKNEHIACVVGYYQLAFVTPGIKPCEAISRNWIRLMPNRRM